MLIDLFHAAGQGNCGQTFATGKSMMTYESHSRTFCKINFGKAFAVMEDFIFNGGHLSRDGNRLQTFTAGECGQSQPP